MYETDGGGGFINNSFGGVSPKASKKPDQKRAQNIMPVTASQVTSCPEEGLRIGNVEVYLVTLVGVVRSIENTSVKVTYLLEDDTGCIEGVHWIDGDENTNQFQPTVVENTYCRLSGTIRTQDKKRYIMVFNIQQIMDLHEITSHRLEVALFSKKAEQIDDETEPTGVPSATTGGPIGDGFGRDLGLTELQREVLLLIRQCTSEGGMDSREILPRLSISANQGDVTAAVEFLCGEGHIYTTIDDSHYRTTDAS